MAVRSVFVSKTEYPFFEEIPVEFDWFGGFALSQKRKCQIGLHQNFLAQYPQEKVLEISSSSLLRLGNDLSAMNLHKRTSRGVTSVESAFQSSRIYKDSTQTRGPFPEYLFLSGKECKQLIKSASNGLISYEYLFDNTRFFAPAHHISLFYDFLYLTALMESENKPVTDQLITNGYTAFTDLATKSLNCQARSATMFVGLTKAGLTNKLKSIESYLTLFRTNPDGSPVGPEAYENVPLLHKGKLQFLTEMIPCTFSRECVEQYYHKYCSALSNKKSKDNYLDLQLSA